MNDSPRKVSPLRQRMIEEMRMRQLAPKTRDAYIRAVIHFTRFLGRSPDTATAEDLRRYQLHCVDQGISAITLNATITGLSSAPLAEPGDGNADHGSHRPTFVCRYCGAPMLVIETFARAQHIRGPPGSSAPP